MVDIYSTGLYIRRGKKVKVKVKKGKEVRVGSIVANGHFVLLLYSTVYCYQ